MRQRVDVAALGERLRRVRKKRQLRLREVWKQTGVSVASLSRIERGASKEVDSTTLLALAAWIGTPVETFLEVPSPPRGKRTAGETTPDVVELHLRADKNLDKQTAAALADLFRTAYESLTKKP